MSSDGNLIPGMGAPGDDDERAERETRFSRRALIQAGWSVPVILAVTPSVAFAASGGGHHNDVHHQHSDTCHHVDSHNQYHNHIDSCPHHNDTV